MGVGGGWGVRVLHMTITHDAIGPEPTHPLWPPSRPLLVTSSGHDWRHVETCSLQDPPPRTDIWWLLKQAWSVQVVGTHHI